MKNKLIILLFCFTFLAQAQIKNGTVTYGVKSMFGDAPELLPIKSELDKAKAAENIFTFTLNFNEKEAYFFVNPSLDLFYQSKDDFCDLLGVQTGCYSSQSTNEFRRIKFFKKTKYIQNYEQKADWELTNESKTINGYICYKATTIQYNGVWDDNPKFITTAWYCPAIPVQYGPNGYYGLPGLILEIQTNTTTIFAQKIALNLKNEVKINKVNEGTYITDEEIRKRLISSAPKALADMFEAGNKKEADRNERIEKELKAKKEAKQKTGQ
jgi:GLPGLI family protein